MQVDLVTFLQIITVNFECLIANSSISGTVDNLYNVNEGDVVPFGDFGYSTMIQTAGKINIYPDFIIDKDKINTYSALPCTNLKLIGDPEGLGYEYLTEWQYETPNTNSTEAEELFNMIYSQSNYYRGGCIAGVFGGLDPNSTFNVVWEDNNSFYDKKIGNGYGYMIDSFISSVPHMKAFSFKLPVIPDGFTFKSAYLGIALSSRCVKGIASLGVKCLSKMENGNAKEVFTAKLIQDVSGSPVWGHISSVPPWYCSKYNFTDFLDTDWLWLSDKSAEVNRFTGLKNMKLPNVDSVETYREIKNIGLFFPRDINNGSNGVSDYINFHELCVVFEHENDVSEVFV